MNTRALRTVLFFCAAVLTFTLAGCQTLYVTSDVNAPLARTVQCHTVAWRGSFSGNNPLLGTIANPVNESRLRAAIAAQLSAKGVQLVSSNPDCLIGYGIGVRNVVEGYPYGWGWGGWGWGWGWPGWDAPYAFRQGLIAVNLYDARTGQPLWHAHVHQDLFGLTGDKAAQRIDAAIAAIFMKYPG